MRDCHLCVVTPGPLSNNAEGQSLCDLDQVSVRSRITVDISEGTQWRGTEAFTETLSTDDPDFDFVPYKGRGTEAFTETLSIDDPDFDFVPYKGRGTEAFTETLSIDDPDFDFVPYKGRGTEAFTETLSIDDPDFDFVHTRAEGQRPSQKLCLQMTLILTLSI